MSLPLGADAGATRIDVGGRKGWKLSDGATLWDDGEKEVPTSGLSDETKRAQARIDAGDAYAPAQKGVSGEEVKAIRGVMEVAGDPDKLRDYRKATAKAKIGRKPENERDLPVSDVEIRQNLRIEAKKLLEREIDRLEELKSMAIAGLVLLARDEIVVPGGNPPMRLHEAVLTILKVADSGTPEEMIGALEAARTWQALSAEARDATTLPQPPGGPLKPAVVPPPDDTARTPQASRDLQGGGKPTEYPPTPPKPPPLP